MVKNHLFVIILFCVMGFSHAQQVEHIVSHNKTLVVTNPKKGVNSYKQWVAFPDKAKSVRRIMLNIKFECPDSLRCGSWDYVDHVRVRQKNDSTTYEIARLLTPYGGFFTQDWSYNWQVDITDFSAILRDTIEVDYIHSGYEDPNTKGWKVTVDFKITYGNPVAKPLAIHKLYDGSYKYGYKDNPIEQSLVPVTVKPNTKMAFSKIRIYQTGHGMDPDGCGEFCSKYRDILLDGKLIDRRDIWKTCGDNALYPQAGTWIFDRANWCPGNIMQPEEHLIRPKANNAFTIDFNMEPYETEKPSASELLSAYVIEYGKIQEKYDVTLIDIIQPTNKNGYDRNYIEGALPIIKIKNNGSKPLQTVTIHYGFEGETPQIFNWQGGNIPFGQEALITLPKAMYSKKEATNFVVELTKPNGKPDAFKYDNVKQTQYQRPDVLPNKIIVNYKTNAKPWENTYSIQDDYGNSVFKKDSLGLMPNTIYRDTVALKAGHYTFKIQDTKGDGLEFWYHADAGRGDIKLLNTQGQLLKQVGSDFGNQATYNFLIDSELPKKAIVNKPFVTVFPTQTQDSLSLDYFANHIGNVQVLIVDYKDENKIIEQYSYPHFKNGTLPFSLAHLPKQSYYIKVLINTVLAYKKRIQLK